MAPTISLYAHIDWMQMSDITFNDYQQMAWSYRAWPDTPEGNLYPVIALSEEAGEVSGKIAKALRKGVEVDKEALTKELGDLAWQLAAVATTFDIDLEDIIVTNLEKLADRQERGVIVGEGDGR